MIATIFAVKQLNYMQDRDPGFNRDQVVTIPLDQISYRKFDVLKQDLLANSLVSGVTGAQDVPAGEAVTVKYSKHLYQVHSGAWTSYKFLHEYINQWGGVLQGELSGPPIASQNCK